MFYTVLRIDEDLDFGCEERTEDAPVMAVAVLRAEDGSERHFRMADRLLYERGIDAGCRVEIDSDYTLRKVGR